MFTLSRTTADDRYLIKNLNWKPLSGGMYVEIHVSSLLNQKLITHREISERGIHIPKWATISHVKKIQEPKKKGDKQEEYMVNMVSFMLDGAEHVVDELTFSMLLKRCFHTKKSTVCFSLRDEDKPKNT